MKKFIHIFIVVIFAFGCEKDAEQVNVAYRLSNAIADTDLTYRNVDGQIVTQTIEIQSLEDVWTKPLDMNEGDIVYLSAIYFDSTSSVKLQILVDGKVYKEASSNQKPGIYLTVSGTIPY